MSSGEIEVNKKLCLGPSPKGEFKEVVIRAIHCKKIEVKKVFKGQYCTLEVNINDCEVRKGMVLVNPESVLKGVKIFEAELWNISEKEIKIVENKTQFIISSGHIRQEALLISDQSVKDKEESIVVLKPDEPLKVKMEFRYNNEYLKIGSHILIMESNIKCYGIVTKTA